MKENLRVRKMWASKKGGPPEATLETTIDIFTIELYYKRSPRTCKNFMGLARRGYYSSRGKFEDEIKQELKHIGAGILSMANAGPIQMEASSFSCWHRAHHWMGLTLRHSSNILERKFWN